MKIEVKFESGYMIIAGERRYKACVQLGWDEIPCMVMDATDIEQYRILISENLQRMDKSEVEKAEEIHEYQVITGLSSRQIAKEFGVAQPYVIYLLHLHGYPDEVKQMVKSEEVSAKSIRPLSQLQTPQEQIKVAEHIRDNRMTYSEAKATVDAVNSLPPEVRSTLADDPEVTVSDVIGL